MDGLILGIILIGLILGLPIAAIAMAGTARSEIKDLRNEVADLQLEISGIKRTLRKESEIETPKPAKATHTIETLKVTTPPPLQMQKDFGTIRPEIVHSIPSPKPPDQPMPFMHPVSEPPPPVSPTDRKEDSVQWEMLLAGNWLNRIGAVALLFGIGFFLKYAFEHHWIAPCIRVMMGTLTGAIVLLIGDHFQKKNLPVFAQGLAGAGVSILYLTAYASYNMYHVLSMTWTFAFMSAVTVISVVQALRYNAIAVSFIGLIGGFLTPVILSGGGAGGGNGVGLFTYITLLDMGLLAVSVVKDDWFSLEPGALIGTVFIFLGWYDATSANSAVALTFVTIFWALFFAVDIYRNRRTTQSPIELRFILGLTTAALYYFGMYAIVDRNWHNMLALSTLLLAAVYAGIASIRPNSQEKNWFTPRCLLTAIALLTFAVNIRYSGYTMISIWSLEALIITLAGIRYRAFYVWATGLCVLAIAIERHFALDNTWAYQNLKTFHLILNLRFLGYSALCLASAITALVFSRQDDEKERLTGTALHYIWITLLFTLMTVEVNDYLDRLSLLHQAGILGSTYDYAKPMIFALIWAIYSLPLAGYGILKRWTPLALTGLLALAAAVGFVSVQGVTYDPIQHFRPILNLRAVMFLAIIGRLVIQHRWFSRNAQDRSWSATGKGILQFAIAVLGFELITVETADYFHKLAQRNISTFLSMNVDSAEGLMFSGLWAIYALFLISLGVTKQKKVLTSFGLTTAAISAINLCIITHSFTPIQNYSLLLNARALGYLTVVGTLLIQQQILSRNRSTCDWFVDVLPFYSIGISLILFQFITLETWDFFARSIYLTHNQTAISQLMDLRQAALSVAWLVYSIAVMGYGVWRRMRNLRLVAIALFYLSIFKVFFYDLSSLETLYRILSFIGLGLILLATSYIYQRYKNVILQTGVER